MKKIYIPFCFFLILTILFLHNSVIFSGFKKIQTDPGDTRFNNYILEHIHKSIKNGFKEFFSPNFFYPHKNNLFFSDLQIFYYPFYGIFRITGFEYDTSFQLFMILSTILNFCLCFYFFHIIDQKKPFFNGFGAFFFSSANMRACQIGHQQLLPNIYILLCFIFIFLIFKNFKENKKRTKVYLLLFTVSFIFQAWSGFYNFYMLFLYVLFLFFLIFIYKTKEIILFFKNYALFLIFSIIFLTIFLFPYIKMSKILKKEVEKRSLEEVFTMLPQWKSYLYMGEENLIYGKLPITNFLKPDEAAHEHRLGLGFITLGIFIFSIFKLKREFLVKINLLIILIFFLITLYIPPKITFWKVIYDNLFSASALRSITRLVLILLLPVSFILLTFLKKINPKISLFLCFLIILEQLNKIPSYDKYFIRNEVENLKNIAEGEKLPFFYGPIFAEGYFWKYQLDAQWAALLSGVPTLNGYSGVYPKSWALFENIIMDEKDFQKISRNLKIWFQDKKFLWIQTIPENRPFISSAEAIIPEKLHFFIDKIGERNWKEFKNPVKAEKEIKISGWAKDLRFPQEKTKIFMKVNDFTIPLNYGIKREDVSRVYGEDYLNSGFEGNIDLRFLKEKGNTLGFIAIFEEKYCSFKKVPFGFNLKK